MIYPTIGILEAKLFKIFLIIKYFSRLLYSGIRTIAPEENYPPVMVRFWVRVRFRVGEYISSGAIVLEPYIFF